MSARWPAAILAVHLLLTVGGLAGAAPAPAAPEVPPQLLKERLETARQGLAAATEQYRAGRGSIDEVYRWTRRVRKAELALTAKKDERIAAHEKLLEVARQIEEMAKGRFEAGRVPIHELLDAKYNRIEAEMELAREKAAK